MPPKKRSHKESKADDPLQQPCIGDELIKPSLSSGVPTTSSAKLYQTPPYFHSYKLYNELWPEKTPPNETPFAVLSDVLADISVTSSRLSCIKLLAYFFLAILERSPNDLLPAVYIIMNKQGPPHEGLELGIGEGILLSIVSDMCGITLSRARDEYKRVGDLGEVAQLGKRNQCTLIKTCPLTINHVFQTFRKISLMSGKNANQLKADAIRALLRSAAGAEVSFIIRALQGKMRIGLAETTILTVLGHVFTLKGYNIENEVFTGTSEQLQADLNRNTEGILEIYNQIPSLEIILPVFIKYGGEVLSHNAHSDEMYRTMLGIRPGIPIRPQLAQPKKSISEIWDSFEGQRVTCEYKYDGERAQIHYSTEGLFSIFSRNLETQTMKYPDLIDSLHTLIDKNTLYSFIIDAEIVAINPHTGSIRPFQVLQQRPRKHVNRDEITVPVCLFAFDILYVNGNSVLHLSLEERRSLFFKTFTKFTDFFQFVKYINVESIDDIQPFFDMSVSEGCEGLMIKTLDHEASYSPGKRSNRWIKLKKDYIDGLADTLDLVPIGAFYGKGKRTGIFGGYLMACYNPETEEYQSICKIGSGFLDHILDELSTSLEPFMVSAMPRYYRSFERPDVWLTENQVWEIKAADLSLSPAYMAAIGLVDDTKGIALRFPRFLGVRNDKNPMDATTSFQVAELYSKQSHLSETQSSVVIS